VLFRSETIQKRITELFAGQGKAAAESYVGQMNKLAIASEQASEIIGKGLVDSLLILSENTSVDDLALDMLDAARNTAAFTKSVVDLAKAINAPIKGLSEVIANFVEKTSPFVNLIIEGDPSGFMTKKPPAPSTAPSTGFNGKTFYADAQKNADALAKAEEEAKRRAAELLAIKRRQQALEAKILKDKRLGLLIDKANLALGKGQDVFDIDKIQNAAALANQAEQLGKATNGSQILQIANDTARLNVKKSILALEDAIAAKDEAAITAATKKLNADIGILGALTGQDLKLANIKTILDSLKPKDLINIDNLKEAIRLLGQISTTSITAGASSTSTGSTFNPVSGFTAGVYGKNTPYAPSAEDLISIFGAIPSIPSGAMTPPSAGFLGGISGQKIEITVNTGVGDPNAIAEAIDQVLTDAVQRGTLRGTFATS
jgi:hypothetical protein